VKCYWVNSEEHTVTETEFSSLADIRQMIGGHLELAYQWLNGDVLYVNEDGLRLCRDHWFALLQRTDQFFAGNGVLVGPELPEDDWEDGHSNYDPKTPLRLFEQYVVFVEGELNDY